MNIKLTEMQQTIFNEGGAYRKQGRGLGYTCALIAKVGTHGGFYVAQKQHFNNFMGLISLIFDVVSVDCENKCIELTNGKKVKFLPLTNIGCSLRGREDMAVFDECDFVDLKYSPKNFTAVIRY